MWDEDHISQYLSEHANLKFWKVAIKPGKPVAFAEINQTPFLGLPGNPVAAYVCFQWFVRPLVRSLLGQLMDPPLPMHMPLAMDVSAPSPRDRFLRAKPIEIEPGKVALSLFSSDSSSFLTSLCWGEGLGCVRKHTVPKAGDQIDYYPFSVF